MLASDEDWDHGWQVVGQSAGALARELRQPSLQTSDLLARVVQIQLDVRGNVQAEAGRLLFQEVQTVRVDLDHLLQVRAVVHVRFLSASTRESSPLLYDLDPARSIINS